MPGVRSATAHYADHRYDHLQDNPVRQSRRRVGYNRVRARKLMQAGVEFVTTRYNGTIHDFMMLNALAHAGPRRSAIAQAYRFLENRFFWTKTGLEQQRSPGKE